MSKLAHTDPTARAVGVISIREPYLSQIFSGEKKIEYRTQRAAQNKVLLLHSSKTVDYDDVDDGCQIDPQSLGVIRGVAEFGTAEGWDGDWEIPILNTWEWPRGRWVKARGAAGIWHLEGYTRKKGERHA